MAATINSIFSVAQVQVVQISLLILIVGSLSWLLRNRSPHLACALWAVVFVKCLTPPVMVTPIGLFAWQSPLQSSQDDIEFVPMIGHVAMDNFRSENVEPHASGSACESDAQDCNELPADRSENDGPAKSDMIPGSQIATVGSVKNARAGTETAEAMVWPLANPVSAGRGPTWLNGPVILFAIWLTGIVVILSFVVRQWMLCWMVVRNSRVVASDRMLATVENVKRQLDFKRPVRLLINRSGYGPMVFGYFRPVLVLPVEVAEDPSRKLEPVIAHELIHVRRGDTLLCLIQFVAQTIWWFNPLVWWGSRQTNRVCERCCDLDVVSGLRCKPTEYARSLLNIVELRHSLRGIAAAAGIRPAEVTANRLSWLASQRNRVRRPHRRINGLVAIAAACMVFPAAGIASPQELPRSDRSHTDLQTLNYQADKAFEHQDWATASNRYRQIVHHNPDSGVSWFRLGYSLHAERKLDAAISAHKKATEFKKYRTTAIYNWACALCLQGEHEAAIEKLTEALDAGFALPRPIAEDPDFAAILEDERFVKLTIRHKKAVETNGAGKRRSRRPGGSKPSENETVSGDVYRQLDFWTGAWSVETASGEKVATTTVSKQENGYALHEVWNANDGSSGESFNFYDPVEKTWMHNAVDSLGRIVRLSGSLRESGVLEMKGTATLKNGLQGKCRMTLTQLDDGRLKQELLLSRDKGQTWETLSNGVLVRAKDQPETVNNGKDQ